jgi:hypothetical protein
MIAMNGSVAELLANQGITWWVHAACAVALVRCQRCRETSLLGMLIVRKEAVEHVGLVVQICEFVVMCDHKGIVDTLEITFFLRVATVAVTICVYPPLMAFIRVLGILPVTHLLLLDLAVDVLPMARGQQFYVARVRVALRGFREVVVARPTMLDFLRN